MKEIILGLIAGIIVAIITTLLTISAYSVGRYTEANAWEEMIKKFKRTHECTEI